MSASQHMRRFGQAVGYYPALTKVFGSVSASILFAQLFYWQPKATSPLGVYKTAEELTEETGLSVDEQRGARKKLVKLGVLVETHKRLEHKIYYRIDEDAFDALWGATQSEDGTNGETELPTGETDIPTPEVGNSQSPNGNFPFGKSEIPNRHSNTEDYSRGLQQGITANARAPREPSSEIPKPPPAKPEKFDPMLALGEHGVDEQLAADWLTVRRQKRAPLTQTALDGLVREAMTAGIPVARAVRICVERGWVGFKAAWAWQDDVPQQLQGRVFDQQGNPQGGIDQVGMPATFGGTPLPAGRTSKMSQGLAALEKMKAMIDRGEI